MVVVVLSSSGSGSSSGNGCSSMRRGRSGKDVLFNDALNTFYLRFMLRRKEETKK